MTCLLSLVVSARGAAVSLTAADGVTFAGEAWGSGPHGVVLVHDEARSRADFATLAPRLASAGYHVLAVDLRPSPTAEADWPKLVGDVVAGVGWLHDQGATEVHVLGLGLGANLALSAAAATPAVSDVILVSPGLNLHGLRVSEAIGPFGARPILVVAGAGDALSLRTATWLQSQAAGPAALATYPGTDRGARMLMTAPDLENKIVGWLATSSQPNQAADTIPSKAGELKSGLTALPTTGTRLEDRHR